MIIFMSDSINKQSPISAYTCLCFQYICSIKKKWSLNEYVKVVGFLSDVSKHLFPCEEWNVDCSFDAYSGVSATGSHQYMSTLSGNTLCYCSQTSWPSMYVCNVRKHTAYCSQTSWALSVDWLPTSKHGWNTQNWVTVVFKCVCVTIAILNIRVYEDKLLYHFLHSLGPCV